MKETDLDMEILDYLIDTIKNWVVNDILEDRTRDWKLFFAISDLRKVAKDKHQIELNLDSFGIDLIDSLIKEFEQNISKSQSSSES